MQTCNSCGASITAEIGPPVLAQQGQVVCQPCWKKTAPAPAAAARRPTTNSRAAAATGRSASAAPSTSSRRTGSSAAPAAASSRTASRATPSRAAAAPAAAPAADGDEAPAASRHATRSQEIIIKGSTGLGRHAQKIVMGVMGLLVLAAGVLFFIKQGKDAEDKRIAAKIQTDAEAAMDNVRSVREKFPEEFERQMQAIALAKEPVAKYANEMRSQLQMIESDVINKREAAKSQKDALELLTSAEADVQDLTKLDSVKGKLQGLVARAASMDKDYQARVSKIQQVYGFNVLRGAAEKARAKKDGDLSTALVAYDDAIKVFMTTFKGLTSKPSQEMQTLYKEVVNESDALVDKLVTPEYEAKVEERDLLSTKWRSYWGATPVGIKATYSGRELVVEGIETPGKKVLGVYSAIPPIAEMWSDIVLDIEYTIVSGNKGFVAMYRYLPGLTSYELAVRPDEKSGVQLNKAYHQTIRIVGSKFSLKEPGQNEMAENIKPNVNRNGGIGLAVEPGTKLVISSAKLKVLRQAGGGK